MEWAAAIGVASGVLTFLTFAHDAFVVAREISQRGSTKDNEQLTKIIEHLSSVSGNIRAPELAPDGSEIGKHLIAVNTIANESKTHCANLLEMLKSLTISPIQGESNAEKWRKQTKTIAKNLFKKRSIQDLEKAISSNRSAIIFHLHMFIAQSQNNIKIDLCGLRADSKINASELKVELKDLSRIILQVAKQTQAHAIIESRKSQATLSEQWDTINAMKKSIDSILSSNISETPEIKILKQLSFESMFRRENSIETAKENTFNWLLEETSEDVDKPGNDDAEYEDNESNPSWNSLKGMRLNRLRECEDRARSSAALLEWLRSGSGIFHISGKAGSGKSTLMKLFKNHPRIQDDLKRWADGKRILCAHFFFWRHGSPLQRSLTGLQMSLLFEVLVECPDLIPVVFPFAYDTFLNDANCLTTRFSQPDAIERAMDNLMATALAPQYRLCFFIDGLDEYMGEDGDDDQYGEDYKDREAHHKLAQKLNEWSSRREIKLLVSSRPHNEFIETFQSAQRIDLHTITKVDIYVYAARTIEKCRNFPHVKDVYLDLCSKVTEEANGVFLWAAFAVRGIVTSIAGRASIPMLYKKLKDLPKSLYALYANLLNNLSESDRQQAFKLLHFAKATEDTKGAPFYTIYVSWLDEWDDRKFPASTGQPRIYLSKEISRRLEDGRARLDLLTKGLLGSSVSMRRNRANRWHARPEGETSHALRQTAIEDESDFFRHEVSIFHRTVHDFIARSPEAQNTLHEFPYLTDGRLTLRLHLGMLWFVRGSNIDDNTKDLIPSVLFDSNHDFEVTSPAFSSIWDRWLPFPNDLLSTFERAINHYHSTAGSRTVQQCEETLHPGIGTLSFDRWASFAFNYWALACAKDPLSLVLHGAKKKSFWSYEKTELEPDGSMMSPLLTAAVAGHSDVIKPLISQGHHPGQIVLLKAHVELDEHDYYTHFQWCTIWGIYCSHLMQGALKQSGISTKAKLRKPVRQTSLEGLRQSCLVLEQLLTHGNVDGRVELLCSRSDTGHNPGGSLCSLTLRATVLHINPPNLDRLLELIDARPSTSQSRIHHSQSRMQYISREAPEAKLQAPDSNPSDKKNLLSFDFDDPRPSPVHFCRYYEYSYSSSQYFSLQQPRESHQLQNWHPGDSGRFQHTMGTNLLESRHKLLHHTHDNHYAQSSRYFLALRLFNWNYTGTNPHLCPQAQHSEDFLVSTQSSKLPPSSLDDSHSRTFQVPDIALYNSARPHVALTNNDPCLRSLAIGDKDWMFRMY